MDANIARMAHHLAERHVGFRPHGNTQKCRAAKIAWAVHLAGHAPDTMFSVDDVGNVHALNDAAGARLNLAVDSYFGRTGVWPGAPALALVQTIETPEAIDLPGATFGDRIAFVPLHCGPTVNRYDHLHAMRGHRIDDVWPIAARGMSQ